MMHAFLIIGGTKDSRLRYIQEKQKEWNVTSFDCIRLALTEESIGIASVRDFGRQLLLSPYNSSKKLGIIEDAHSMTVEAQNALLKTLEEPPPRTVLFLETATADSLLPTIVSRCSLVNLGSATTDDAPDAVAACVKTLQQIGNAAIGKRMAMVDEIAKTREDARRWVGNAIVAVRQTMLLQHQPKHAKILRVLLLAQSQLMANVTPKLVVDTIFLHL